MDARSDLWSLGAVLHEMLTGRRPATEPDEVIAALASVPRAVAEIVSRLLAASAEERYPDARSLAQDLGVLADAGKGLDARPAPSVQRFLAELKRRHVFRVAAMYGVMGFAVIEVAGALFPHIPASSMDRHAPRVAGAAGLPAGAGVPGLGLRDDAGRPAAHAQRPPRDSRRHVGPTGQPAVADRAGGRPGRRVDRGRGLVRRRGPAPRNGARGRKAPRDPGTRPAMPPPVWPSCPSGRSETRSPSSAKAWWTCSRSTSTTYRLRKIDPQSIMTIWNRTVGAGRRRPDHGGRRGRVGGSHYAVIGSAVQVGTRESSGWEPACTACRSTTLLGSTQVEGRTDSLTALIDRLAVELLRLGLVPTDAGYPVPNLARATTASLPALKAYLAGEREYRQGRWSRPPPSIARRWSSTAPSPERFIASDRRCCRLVTVAGQHKSISIVPPLSAQDSPSEIRCCCQCSCLRQMLPLARRSPRSGD